jgi:DNA-directed RNA polymerase subunit RPC12/RpoP
MVTIVEDLEEHDRRCGGQWLPIEPRGELNMRCARCSALAVDRCTNDDGVELARCPRCSWLHRAPAGRDPLKRGCVVCGWGTEWDEEEP